MSPNNTPSGVAAIGLPTAREVSDLLDLGDQIEETRLLVGAAFMAVADFKPDDRTTCLRTLLNLIEDRLEALRDSLSTLRKAVA